MATLTTVRSALLLALGLLCISPALHAAPRLVFWLNSFQAPELTADLGKSFTRQTGIQLDMRYIEGGMYKPELIKHALDDETPDVALFPADFLALDKELKFSEIPARAQNKDVMRQVLQTGLQEGRQLGAPVYWGNHLVLYYNRDLVPQPGDSFEEIEQQAPALKAKGLVPLQFSVGEMYSFIPFLSAFGGWPLDEHDKPSLNTEATSQALDFVFGLYNRGIVNKDCHDECVSSSFRERKTPYFIGGDWMYAILSKDLGSSLGVAPLPTIKGRPMVSMFSSYVLAFPKDSLNGPKREALLKFITFMQSQAVQTRWAHEAVLFPVHEKVFKSYVAKAPKNIQVSLRALQRSRPMSNHRNMAFAWAGMSRGYSQMTNGRANARQAAEQMQKAAENAARRAPQ